MGKILLDDDPEYGMRQVLHVDEMTGNFTVETIDSDVAPVLDRNKALQNGARPRTKDGSFEHVASIPPIVLHQWMIEAGVKPAAMHGKEFFAFIRRKLFDPDYRWLRTSSIRW